MKTSDFEYDLPPELIAQEPAPVRSAARMMVLNRANGVIEHGQVRDLPFFLRKGDLLVVNDTRVFPARIFGRKETGGKIEVLFIEEIEPDIWRALVKSSRPLKTGATITVGAEKQIKAELHGKADDESVFLKIGGGSLIETLEREGIVPLPPYIERNHETAQSSGPANLNDAERYQTVYARKTGAVAAPTAGLHFTPELLAELEKSGIGRASITLHVGPGTFKPVRSENVEEHEMEAERFVLDRSTAELINNTRKEKGRIAATGSTVVRTLEAVAQMNNGLLNETQGKTDIFIRPPFNFQVTDIMLTNFHLPRSTLLMMVCAFAGYEQTILAYETAVRERYRFFSYGDCMLIL